MAKSIALYPILRKQDLTLINYELKDFAIFGSKDGQDFAINISNENIMEQQIILEDEGGKFDIENDNLHIAFKIFIEDVSVLFGGNGIASPNATIGIALKWYSKDSLQRGVEDLGKITASDSNNLSFLGSLSFEPGQVRGTLTIEPFIYLKTPDLNLNDDLKHLQNERGYILGKFPNLNFVLDGDGSEFPVKEIFEKGAPLWRLNCLWEDPTEDKFSKTVSLDINKAHPAIDFIDPTNKKYNQYFLNEIVATAVQIIIQKISESSYSSCLSPNHSANIGTVAQAALYFLETFELNAEDPEILAIKIRESMF